MQSWAQSKQQPGQFTGSTGAQIMSQAELSSGFQAWARKVHRHFLHCSLPVHHLFLLFFYWEPSKKQHFLLIPTHAFYEFSGKNTPEAAVVLLCVLQAQTTFVLLFKVDFVAVF